MTQAGAALALALLAAGGAGAQSGDAPAVVTPSDLYDADDLASFRECRVAAFYHLDGPEDPEATVPRSSAEALLEQIAFVMVQSLQRAPPRDFDEVERRLAFTERFMMGFARAVAEGRTRYADLRDRERTLLACFAGVWEPVRAEIEALMQAR